jgi:hypothetical protein
VVHDYGTGDPVSDRLSDSLLWVLFTTEKRRQRGHDRDGNRECSTAGRMDIEYAEPLSLWYCVIQEHHERRGGADARATPTFRRRFRGRRKRSQS